MSLPRVTFVLDFPHPEFQKMFVLRKRALVELPEDANPPNERRMVRHRG